MNRSQDLRSDELTPHGFRPLLPVLCVSGLLGAGPYLVLTYGIVTQRTGTLGVMAWLVLVEVGAVGGRIAAGWWSDRAGRIPQVLSWTAGFGALMLAGVAEGVGIHGPTVLVAGMALCLGVGISAWNGLVYAWAATRIASAQLGLALGWVGAATFLSVPIASPVFGWVAHRGGLGAGWGLMAGAFTAASLVSLIADQRARRHLV